MQTRLKELISSLKVLNDNPENELELGKIISILNKMNEKNAKKNDVQIASYIVTIITVFPELMQHPKNQALKNLCTQLMPNSLQLPKWIEYRFFGSGTIKPEPLQSYDKMKKYTK